MIDRNFTHNNHFTGYMLVILNTLKEQLVVPSKILDLPAGYGLLGNELKALGHDVVYADINEERTDYVQANMELALPFLDNEFDAVVCMEGLEHIINQNQFLNELVRITKKGGIICISIPNISNFWSRLHFLFKGYFYGFSPHLVRVQNIDVLLDKGHISPISIYQLSYLMAVAGAGLLKSTGDRFKKKVLFPIAILIYPFNYFYASKIIKKMPDSFFAGNKKTSVFFNFSVFFSRSLVTFFVKR